MAYDSHRIPDRLCLASLPVEILTAIVAKLGPSQADYDIFRADYKPDVSLYYLAQTCKAVSSIALFKLYEICPLITERHYRSSWLALHTLAARPDIASKVKRIIIDRQFPTYDRYIRHNYRPALSAQEAAFFNRILEAKADMTTIAPMRELQSTSEVLENTDREAIAGSLACLALAIVAPNLTSIVFEGGLTSHLAWFKAGSFPRLEAFALHDYFGPRKTNLEHVYGVLDAAPNFKRLLADSIVRIAMPKAPYTSVTQLVLDLSTLDEDAVALMPAAFPNLESFTYKFSGQRYPEQSRIASPRVISKALLALKQTLTHVVLASVSLKEEMWAHFPDEEYHGMQSLAQMRVLQSLRLPAWFSYPTALVDFLPASIQAFFLDCQELESVVLPDIDALLQALPTRFPHLTQVNFDALDRHMQHQIQQAYEQRGIACSFQDLPLLDCRGD